MQDWKRKKLFGNPQYLKSPPVFKQPGARDEYEKQNSPQVFQQALEEKEPSVMRLGYHATANFGKYKGQTFYDIANIGDFKYLKWLLQNGKFQMHPSCKPHILTALFAEGTESKWEISIKEDKPKKMYRTFVWTTKLPESEHITESPPVVKAMCQRCNYYKNKEVMDENLLICQKCKPEINS